MSEVNVRIGACGFRYATSLTRHDNGISRTKRKYCTYRPCCVLFTNKPTHVKSYKRHLVVGGKILVLEHIEDVKYFHVDPSVKSRLAKCVGFLVKNTNKGERARLNRKRTRRMSQPFPRRGSNGDKCCFRVVFFTNKPSHDETQSRDVLITSTQHQR